MKDIDKSIHVVSPLVTIASLLIIIAGIMYAASIITPILLALFISIICAQPMKWLESRKVPHGLAIIIVMLLIILIFVFLGQLIGSSLAQFTKDAPQYAASLVKMEKSIVQVLQTRGFDVSDDQLMKLFNPGKVMLFTAAVLAEMGALISNMAVVFFILIFMLLELGSFSIKARVISRQPAETIAYLGRISASIRHYMGIKTLIGLLTGFLVWILLKIIGVEYAVLWALIAFLLNYIPNIGSIIAGIPVVLFALVQLGWAGALWTLAGYILINMIVGNVIEPKVMGKGMGLSTLVVFLSLMVWGFVLGTVGMFLSVPLTMTAKIILQQNPKTRWLAVLLGTQEDAKILLEEKQA